MAYRLCRTTRAVRWPCGQGGRGMLALPWHFPRAGDAKPRYDGHGDVGPTRVAPRVFVAKVLSDVGFLGHGGVWFQQRYVRGRTA